MTQITIREIFNGWLVTDKEPNGIHNAPPETD